MNTLCHARWLLLSVVVAGLCCSTSHAEEVPVDDLTKMVVDLLSDKDKEMRAVGLEQVRKEAKGEAATKLFAAQLTKLPTESCVGLLAALADRGDVVALPAVLDVLKTSKEEAVRVAALRATGSLGGVGELPLLVERLSTGAAAEQAAALASVVALRGEATPAAIAAMLRKVDPKVSVTLIEVLATRRALDTVPELLVVAVSDDASVRPAAIAALEQMASVDHLRGLLLGVLKAEPGKERDAAERCVAAVCVRSADAKDRSAPVLEAIKSLSEADQLALLSTLGRVGGPGALAMIESAIADPAKHEIGLRAICNWPDAAIAPRLIELVNKEKDPRHRAIALAALVRVSPLPDSRTDSERLELLTQALELSINDDERNQVVKRARAIRTVEALRFLMPYLEDPKFSAMASESVVELAHHRGLREPNKAEFHKALDRVKQVSKDPVVVDRANRYQNGQTWVRPNPAKGT